MLEFPFKKLQKVNYVIIALIILSILLLTRDIIHSSLAKKSPQTAETDIREKAEMIVPATNIMSYAPIVEQNPFGPPMKFQPIAKGQRPKRREGSLSKLMLYGTVTGPEHLSYAILTDTSQPGQVRQELFAYGEEVYDYGTLTKILSDYIEITQGAKTHTIDLVDINELGAKGLRTMQSHSSPSQLVKKINEKQFVLNQRKVEEALNSPEQVLSDARLYPNIKQGKHEGFRILEVKRGGLYDSLGLMNRDILLKINGLDLVSPEAAMQAMTALKGMNAINLDIIRNGAKMTLNYQIR
jgi:type II secretion system protein C